MADVASSGHGRAPHRDRHLPVHRYRGLDAAASRPRRRGVRRRARRSPSAPARGLRRRSAGTRSTRRVTRSSSASHARATRSSQRATANAPWPSTRGRTAASSGSGWGSTPPRRPPPPKATWASASIAGRGSAAAGHGGQVLISHTTHDLVGDDDAEFAFADLGEHRLKDLTEPQRLFQLVLEGLPERFPPLRTLENRPTNLPCSRHHSSGASREVAEVVELLRRADVRAGHAHRPRRRREDPARTPGRGRARRGLPARRVLRDARSDRRPRARPAADRSDARR